MSGQEQTAEERVAEIKDRWGAATPGPWFWWGNTDTHSVALCGQQPGLGVCEVISTIGVRRSTKSKDADDIREGLSETMDMTPEAIEAEVQAWAVDPWDNPIQDERLAITDERYIRHSVEEVAVYQVARNQGLPDDTPRDHPKLYRADVCDLRVPNGKALAAAWGDVHYLLGLVEQLQAKPAIPDVDDPALTERVAKAMYEAGPTYVWDEASAGMRYEFRQFAMRAIAEVTKAGEPT